MKQIIPPDPEPCEGLSFKQYKRRVPTFVEKGGEMYKKTVEYWYIRSDRQSMKQPNVVYKYSHKS